jgi:hypothetical protein
MTTCVAIPAADYSQTQAFAHNLVMQLKREHTLETEGIVLACGDVEAVIGDYGATVFDNKSIVDDLSLCMTPIVYELIGYLAPGLRYTAVNHIPPKTGLIRILHVQKEQRNPLFAINMFPVGFDGLWSDIEMSRPSSVCPTFELMAVKPDQQITFKGGITDLDMLDLRQVNVLEFSRLGSMLEMVMGKPRTHTLPPEPLVDRFKAVITQYKDDPNTFMRVMLLGRGLLAFAFWLYLIAKENELIFGNLTQGIVDRFVESMGVSPEQQAVQFLEVSHYHDDSPALRVFQPYFDRHRVVPFLIEWKESVQNATLHSGCESICSMLPAH